MKDQLALAVSVITLAVVLLGGSYAYGRTVERLDYVVMQQAQITVDLRRVSDKVDGVVERTASLEAKSED